MAKFTRLSVVTIEFCMCLYPRYKPAIQYHVYTCNILLAHKEIGVKMILLATNQCIIKNGHYLWVATIKGVMFNQVDTVNMQLL